MKLSAKFAIGLVFIWVLVPRLSVAQELESIPVPPAIEEGDDDSDIQFENDFAKDLEMELESDDSGDSGDLDLVENELQLDPIPVESEQSTDSPLLILQSETSTSQIEQSTDGEPTLADSPAFDNAPLILEDSDSEPALEPIPDRSVQPAQPYQSQTIQRAQYTQEVPPQANSGQVYRQSNQGTNVRQVSGSAPITLSEQVVESSPSTYRLEPTPTTNQPAQIQQRTEPPVIRPGVVYEQPMGFRQSGPSYSPRTVTRSVQPVTYQRPNVVYRSAPVVQNPSSPAPSIRYSVPTALQPPVQTRSPAYYGGYQSNNRSYRQSPSTIVTNSPQQYIRNLPNVTRVERTGPDTYRVTTTTESVRYVPMQVQVAQPQGRTMRPAGPNPASAIPPEMQYVPFQPFRNAIRGAYR